MYNNGSVLKKFIKVSFVTFNLKLQKYTCIRMLKTHNDSPKSVTVEVQQSVKTSNGVMNEQTINA